MLTIKAPFSVDDDEPPASLSSSSSPFPYRCSHTMIPSSTSSSSSSSTASSSSTLSPVLAVRLSGSGQYCLSGGSDRIVRLWNPHRGIEIKQFKGAHGHQILDLQISEDNSRFASCGGDRLVFLWDISSGRVLRRLQGHTARVNCLHFSLLTDSSVLFSGSYDKTVKAWDMRSNDKDPIQTLDDFKDSVTDVVVTDYEVLACSVDGQLRYYDLRMGQLVTDHICHALTSLRLSHDRNCVLLSCLDSTLRLMDKGTGELLCDYKGHTQQEFTLESCFTHTDAHVISGSEDGKVFIWDLVDSKIAHSFQAHDKPVVSIDYHPSDTFMVTASVDGKIKCWK